MTGSREAVSRVEAQGRVSGFLHRSVLALMLAGLVLGIVFAPAFKPYSGLALPVLLVVLFFSSLGLDVKRVFLAQDWGAVARANLAVLVLSPFAAWAVGLVLGLPSEWRLGLVFVAAMPAGISTLVFAREFCGKPSLSLGMLVTGVLLVPLSAPFMLAVLERAVLPLPPLELAVQLAVILFSPLALAIVFRRVSPSFAAEAAVFGREANLGLLPIVCLLTMAATWPGFSWETGLAFFAALACVAFNFVIGKILFWKDSPAVQRSGAFGLVFRNFTLATTLAITAFGASAAITPAAYGFWSTLVIIGYGYFKEKTCPAE